MASLLPRIKSRLFVRSRRRLTRALAGEYASRTEGRSHDFDDLRDYVAGDPVRDIDWKATVRSGSTQVRRYHATRQRTLVLLCDASRAMDAAAPSGENKRELAVLAAGVMGLLALRHGDRVVMIHGDSRGVTRSPAVATEAGLERLLGTLHRAIGAGAAEPGTAGLLAAASTVQREALQIVIAGEVDSTDVWEAALARAATRRDLLWIEVADANPARALSGARGADVVGGGEVPRHLGRSTRLADQYDELTAARWEAVSETLDSHRVSRCRLDGTDGAIAQLLSMLARRPYGR